MSQIMAFVDKKILLFSLAFNEYKSVVKIHGLKNTYILIYVTCFFKAFL